MFRWTTWWSRSRYGNPFSAHEKKNNHNWGDEHEWLEADEWLQGEPAADKMWAQSHDWTVNAGQVGNMDSTPQPTSAGSAMKPQSETIPPRWPWKAHHFLLYLNSLVIASKPPAASTSHYIITLRMACRAATSHLATVEKEGQSRWEDERQQRGGGGRGGRWTGVWILNT